MLSVRDVAKRYGPVNALVSANLNVTAGSVHGLLGPNGAGKTTLLRIVFGLARPDAGRVEVLGAQPRSAIARTGGVAGFVDSPRLYPYFTARKNLELLSALDGGHRDDSIDAVIEQCGLVEIARRKVSVFSTGQRQRLGLAAALLRGPRLLIVDEPTTGLDPIGVIDLRIILRSLADAGAAVVLSSHDMAEVEAMCDAVTILHRGATAYTGSMHELRAMAPDPTYRLSTSDDDRAVDLAGGGRRLARHSDGGLLVRADLTELDNLTVRLGRAGIAIRELQRQDSALQAMFLQLVAEPAATG